MKGAESLHYNADAYNMPTADSTYM